MKLDNNKIFNRNLSFQITTEANLSSQLKDFENFNLPERLIKIIHNALFSVCSELEANQLSVKCVLSIEKKHFECTLLIESVDLSDYLSELNKSINKINISSGNELNEGRKILIEENSSLTPKGGLTLSFIDSLSKIKKYTGQIIEKNNTGSSSIELVIKTEPNKG